MNHAPLNYYRLLCGMLALRSFTVDHLAHYASVEIELTRRILQRETGHFVDRVEDDNYALIDTESENILTILRSLAYVGMTAEPVNVKDFIEVAELHLTALEYELTMDVPSLFLVRGDLGIVCDSLRRLAFWETITGDDVDRHQECKERYNLACERFQNISAGYYSR